MGQIIMKLKIIQIGILILGLVMLAGCDAQLPFTDGIQKAAPSASMGSAKRGIVIEFQQGKPQNEIFGDFLVGLDISNYMDESVSVSVDVWDVSPLQGFTDKAGVSYFLEPAIYDLGKFYKPFVEKYNLGMFNYQNVKVGDYTQFLAELRYGISADVDVNFCVTNPDYEKDSSCSLSETLSGSKLGDKNSKYPITIKSIKKTIYGADESSVFLNLDISISNEGKGELINPLEESIFDGEILNFNLYALSDSLEFTCRSDDATNSYGEFDSDVKSLPMDLKLKGSSSIKITCTSTLVIDEPLKDVRIKITTDYDYLYKTSTRKIEVKG